jgi:pilus assembly protein CpaC
MKNSEYDHFHAMHRAPDQTPKKVRLIRFALIAGLAAGLTGNGGATPEQASKSTPVPATSIAMKASLQEPVKVKPAVSHAIGKTALPYAPIAQPGEQEQIPEIELFVGESRVFPTPGVARIAVGNGQIITASALDDKDTIVFANGPGTSTLFVWNQDGRYQRIKVSVQPGDISRIARDVATFLSSIPKAKASVVGDKVIVEGDELSDADRDKVAELARRYPQIINFTSPIGWEQMVMMDVKVVEFPKTELRELGLKWSAVGGAAVGSIWAPFRHGDQAGRAITIGGTTAPIAPADASTLAYPSGLAVMSALNLGLSAQLNALEQNGTATILAEPQLSTRSGYKASFLAGGELPYSVSTVNGVTVQFKPYGIKLEIEPRVGRNGVVRAVIESEVSSIDASFTTTGGPGLLTRRTKTEFNVNQGETIVLSGLLQRSNSTDIDKVPLLGDIPILGALFRSRRFQNKETELVVFVTPTVVDSRSPGLADRVKRATDRLEQNLGAPPFLTNPLQPGVDAGKVNQALPTASTVSTNQAQ